MNRRQAIAGLGAIITGGGAAVGSGAFTSTTAERGVSVSVVNEADAYLALDDETDNINDAFSDNGTGVNGELKLEFNDEQVTGGVGLGTDSVYEFDGVFNVANEGTQTVYFSADFTQFEAEAGESLDSDEDVDVEFYAETERDHLLNGTDAVLEIEQGHDFDIGVRIETYDAPANVRQEGEAMITASDDHSADEVVQP